MKMTFWGATTEVTGSMTFLELPEGICMIDAGLSQGSPESAELNLRPLPYQARDIKAIVLTHAHLDHSGYLPKLYKDGFRGIIHATKATAKLARIILLDSAKISKGELYDEKDALRTLDLFRIHDWESTFDLLGTSARLFSAGHILGASSVLIQTKDKKIVFSGDLGRTDDPLLLPHKSCPLCDVIVMESTYGGRTRPQTLETELASFIMKIGRENRVGIIASFAVARAQTLLTLIHEFFQRHPEEKFRVVMDSPMMKEANNVYQKFSSLTLRPESAFEALDKVEVIEHRRQWMSIREADGPLLIVSSSGMLTGGRVLNYLSNWKDDPRAILFLPGFQAPGTTGRNLLEGKREITISDEETIHWSGEVLGSEAFSSHADHDELIGWATENNPEAKVYLLHGDKEAKSKLREKLKEKGHEVKIPGPSEIVIF